MTLRRLGHIKLPANRSSGGFDHADIHAPMDRLYVAHTSNDAIDLIDIARDRYIESVPGFTAVAGALVSEARGLVFTSNRGENTVSVFVPGAERDAFKIAVGVKPNGLAFDAARGILITANVASGEIRAELTGSELTIREPGPKSTPTPPVKRTPQDPLPKENLASQRTTAIPRVNRERAGPLSGRQ